MLEVVREAVVAGRDDGASSTPGGARDPRRAARCRRSGLQGLSGDDLCIGATSRSVHGIPSSKTSVERGRHHLSIDLGRACWTGFCGDSAVTVGRRAHLVEAAELASRDGRVALEGISCPARAPVSDIGHAVQSHVEASGFSVVGSSSATASDSELHEDPQIPNYGDPGRGPRLAGRHGARDRADGERGCGRRESAAGRMDGRRRPDRSLSAHFEHTVAVTSDGVADLAARTVGAAKEVRTMKCERQSSAFAISARSSAGAAWFA